MSPTTSSTKPIADKPAPQEESSAFAIKFEAASDLSWLPYRTMLDLLRHTHSSATQMLNFHRKSADDLREILRSQQDLFFSLSERFLEQVSKIGTGTSAAELYAKSLDQLQDTTLATMREIGEAVTAAQASSFEALKHQMHLERPEGSDGHSHETAH